MKLVPMIGSPPMPDAGALADAVAGQLVHDLVGERPAARDQADPTRRADVAGNDADLAARRGDQAGTVGTDQARASGSDEGHNAAHVHDRDTFGDAHDQRNACVHRFEDGSRCRHRAARRSPHTLAPVSVTASATVLNTGTLSSNFCPPLPGRHPGYDGGAVLQHLPGMKGAFAAGDPLHQQPRAAVDEDAHAAFRASWTTCCTASSMSLSARHADSLENLEWPPPRWCRSAG